MRYFIVFILVSLSSCSARMSGQYNFPMTINTYDTSEEEIFADCNLFSAETKMSFTTPQEINYQANCGPINILCKSGSKKGEFGIIPKPEDDIEVNTIARATDGETTAVDARTKAKMQGYEGDPCGDCGNYTLVRNGTCMKCNTCGATSGCS